MDQQTVSLLSTEEIEKKDTSLKYQTCGDESSATCIVELPHHNAIGDPNTIRSKVNLSIFYNPSFPAPNKEVAAPNKGELEIERGHFLRLYQFDTCCLFIIHTF